jgi:hypothetical protein
MIIKLSHSFLIISKAFIASIDFIDLFRYGSTNDEIQKTLREKYHKHGVSILVSAFGATEFPTSKGYDAVQCATKLGEFVLANNLDGADIDWEDNSAMNKGLG